MCAVAIMVLTFLQVLFRQYPVSKWKTSTTQCLMDYLSSHALNWFIFFETKVSVFFFSFRILENCENEKQFEWTDRELVGEGRRHTSSKISGSRPISCNCRCRSFVRTSSWCHAPATTHRYGQSNKVGRSPQERWTTYTREYFGDKASLLKNVTFGNKINIGNII